jgi:hypothetical protein
MDCKYFDGCSAPLCPRDSGQEKTAWFPDEDICRLADVPDWVKRQRKVSRKAAQGGYFTLAMLTHDCRITKGGEKKTAVLHRARLEKTRLNIGPDVVSGEKGIQVPLAPFGAWKRGNGTLLDRL